MSWSIWVPVSKVQLSETEVQEMSWPPRPRRSCRNPSGVKMCVAPGEVEEINNGWSGE